MAYHDNAIGRLVRTDPTRAKAEMRAALERSRGCLNATAFELGIGRRWLYRLIYRLQMWPVVNEVRKRADEEPQEHDLIAALKSQANISRKKRKTNGVSTL